MKVELDCKSDSFEPRATANSRSSAGPSRTARISPASWSFLEPKHPWCGRDARAPGVLAACR